MKLEIDAGSDYCRADGVAEIRAAPETIGITRTILNRSSWPGGCICTYPCRKR